MPITNKKRIENLEKQAEKFAKLRLGYVPIPPEARKIYGDGEWGTLEWIPKEEFDAILDRVYSMPIEEVRAHVAQWNKTREAAREKQQEPS